ncbi:two pore domain potassium channel family protein [Vibrio parahaemolyticus]|nr:two pore domain potassium channel family protein [Vibrio parahaemolyticus]EGR3229452.1 two pore domain potassium channel family protein [Vibrio parahaemolyticus]EJG0180751.1 two pore domain potassium channel family protein [Vibrio parahaemolyticus]
MLGFLFRIKVLERLGLIKNYSSNKMFKRPIIHAALFITEFLLIGFFYYYLENYVVVDSDPISLSNSYYFTVITASTVGYGDHAPGNVLTQWYVIIFMILYLPTRFIYTAGVAGFLFKHHRELKKIGRWFPMLKKHIIVYCDSSTIERNNFLWLKRFVGQHRKSLKYCKTPILLVNNNQDANSNLINYFTEFSDELKGVEFVNANLNEKHFFEKISIDHAERVYILADENDVSTDSDVFDMVYRIEKETSYSNGVTAEIVNDRNRERIRNLGANVILRPNRSMPELLVTSTIAPGASQMVEEIVSRGGDSIERFEIDCSEFRWGDVLYQLSMNDVGIATAVIYKDESVDSNPCGKSIIKDAKALLILIHEMKNRDYDQVQNRINEVINDVCRSS